MDPRGNRRIRPPWVLPAPAEDHTLRPAVNATAHDPTTTRFLLRAAEMLHAYGTPAHRLERVVVQLAAYLDLEVQVFSQPTSIFIGFEGEGHDRVRLLRVEPGGVDLGKLVEIDELLEEVEDGSLPPAAALVRMDALHARAPRWSGFASVFGHALAAGSAAVFFGGRFADTLLSAALGALIGLLELAMSRRPGVTGVFEPMAAFIAAAGGLAGAFVWDGVINDRIVALASIIVIVPGLSLTVALVELATRHLASGTARLAGAASVFLTIAFGAYLGRVAVMMLAGDAERTAPLADPEAWLSSPPALAVAIVFAAVGFGMLFGARLREMPWILAASAVGFVTARVATAVASQSMQDVLDGAISAGPVRVAAIAAFAGALAVALFANGYARFRDRPATVPLLPGLLVLVPGSIGYRALSAFTERNAITGLDSVFQMLLVAAALVGGILIANAILPPRRVL